LQIIELTIMVNAIRSGRTLGYKYKKRDFK
jgi:hypothetical protein